MGDDKPAYQQGVDIEAQTIGELAVEIAAQTISELDVDVTSQSIGNLAVDLAAQSIQNIGVDIEAQTISDLGIDIQTQSIDVLDNNIKLNRAEDIALEDITRTGDVADLETETTVITPPAGEVWEIQYIDIEVDPTGGGGTHQVELALNGLGGTTALFAEYNGSDFISYSTGRWQNSPVEAQPADQGSLQLDIIKGLRIDAGRGIEFVYFNDSGATNTGNRDYQVYARKIQVS
jgi:hypothetical protein